ncbi:MAG: pantoate--beta-alanine ligase [Flavobacteriaceae bacterium]
MSGVGICRDVAGLRQAVAGWRAAGERVALVPTMGALHEGHLSLIDKARERGAERIVASIFVNPTQFSPSEDFDAYPRPLDDDLAALAGRSADLAYVPAVSVMYPRGFAIEIVPGGPATADLEAACRPGHFAGVATVVAKLLLQCRPDMAVFGEKDYQQLLVIRRMARDLDIACDIVAAPVARDAHGLALSSRNVYLSGEQLAVARRLNAILRRIADDPATLPGVTDELLRAGFDAVDYVAIRDAETLGPPEPGRPRRLLAVARIGEVRLLDNMPVEG